MAVVHVKEITGRGGDREMNTRRRYTRVFQVLTDNPTDGTKTVRDHLDLPALGDIWVELDASGLQTDIDLAAVCVEKRATQNDPDNLQNWMVYCEYVGIGDPTAEPPNVSWSTEAYQETTQKDYEGTLVANSAGTPYREGLTRDRRRFGVTIKRNVLTWSPLEREQYIDTINAFEFLVARHPPGFPILMCKIDDISAEPVYYPNYPVSLDIQYWRETIKVSIDRRGWDAQYLDVGPEVFVRNAEGTIVLKPDGSPQKRRLQNGGVAAEPQLLDGNGNEKPFAMQEVFNPFSRYEPKDWSNLNLDY